MKKIVERVQMFTNYRKQLIAILVIVALLTSGGTFSFWAGTVQGDSNMSTMTFQIGEYIQTNYDFVLNQENLTYQYEIDIAYLLEDYKNNKDDVIFGIIWNDPSLSEQFKDQVVNGTIQMTMELKYYQNGLPVTSKTERTLDRLITLTQDSNNPDQIIYGQSAIPFEFSVSLKSNKKYSQVAELQNYEVYVEITYSINY